MIFVLLGPPGCGKGTQATRIAQKYGLKATSTGEIIRGQMAAGTEVGKAAQSYVKKGELVPDEVVIAMVKEELRSQSGGPGVVLDGFPRTVNQANSLADILTQSGLRLDGVLNFVVSEEEIVRRLAGRRVCEKCGASYHILFMPPHKEGICDQCGGALIQRADDAPDSVRERLRVYAKQTEPLIVYYRERRLLNDIEGIGTPEEVAVRVESVVDRIARGSRPV
ncbi:MAG: adenylate kinase [Armatimonadetes bacterium]|nr:adenylate kinase [Armatimonadota bacterium]